MATIASLAVKLEASPAGLIAGLGKAQTAVAGAANRMSAMAGRISSSLGGIGSRIAGGDLAGGLTASVEAAGSLATKLASVGSVAAGLPGIGVAAGVAIGGATAAVGGLISGLQKVKSLFDDGAAKILEQRSAAIMLNESLRETAALALAAGGDTERMTRAMMRMNETIQSARMGDSSAVGLLAGRLGLNAENLAKMGTGQRLESVIKSLAGLRDELTKSSVELGIFGERSALAFGPLLSSGNGLDKFREQVDRFGLSMGASSTGEMKAMADRVLQAKRAVNQLGLAWEGIKVNIAAGLAPVLAKTAEMFNSLGVDAKRIQDWSTTGAMKLAKGGAYVQDAWTGLKNLWDELERGFYHFVIGVEGGLKSMFEKLAQLPAALGGGISAELGKDVGREIAQLQKMADDVAKRIEQRRKERSALEDVKDWFAGMQHDVDSRKKLAENAEATRSRYEPMRAPIQLSGAQEFGSQEAYKTIGQFLGGQNADMAKQQLAQAQRIEEAIRRGDITLKDIKNILKRHGVIKVGKI